MSNFAMSLHNPTNGLSHTPEPDRVSGQKEKRG